jgi:hypothetical protein
VFLTVDKLRAISLELMQSQAVKNAPIQSKEGLRQSADDRTQKEPKGALAPLWLASVLSLA